MRSEADLLIDIVEHARFIRQRMKTITRADFDNDMLVQLGLAHALQIIGEAAKLLQPAVRSRFPTIPWPQIVGMRHRLVHEYFRIDPERVWDAATIDVDELLAALEPEVQVLIDARNSDNSDKG